MSATASLDLELVRAGLYFEEEHSHHNSSETDTANLPRATPGQTGSQGKNDARRYLPHVEASANVTINNTTSHTTMTQTFVNDTNRLLNRVYYCFPLYHYSAITAFSCWHGDSHMEGSVKPKRKGREVFEKAVEAGTIAALFEQHTSEVFEISIGIMKPFHIVKVEIQYVAELRAEIGGEGVVLTIPSSVAPRYGKAPDSYSVTLGSGDQMELECGMEIRVNVSMPVAIRSLKSRAHIVTTEMGFNDAKASASFFRDLHNPPTTPMHDITKARALLETRDSTLDKDFALVVTTASSHDDSGPNILAPRALCESCQQSQCVSAIQIAFTPRDLFAAHELQLPPNLEIVLLVDLSSSMHQKMKPLKQALHLVLRNLPSGLFNICVFGSSFEPMWSQSRTVNEPNLADAKRYVGDLLANKGQTEILEALHKVTNRTRKNFATQVIVFTDGEVWNVDAVHKYIISTKKLYGDELRFFSLGIGDRVSHKLVEGIGKYGGGYSEVIPVASSERWDDRIKRMMAGLRTPSDWQLKLRLKDQDGDLHARSGFSFQEQESSNLGKIIQVPHHLPVVHGLSRTIVYMFVKAPLDHYVAVEIEGVSNGGAKVVTQIPLEYVSAVEPVFNQLAARALLSDIEMGYSWLHSPDYHPMRKSTVALSPNDIDMEAEHIAMCWGLASSWTGFIGVSESREDQLQSTNYHFGKNRRELEELMKPRRRSISPNEPHHRHTRRDNDDGPDPGGPGGSGQGSATGGSTGSGSYNHSAGGVAGGSAASDDRQDQSSSGGGSSGTGSTRAGGYAYEHAEGQISFEQLAALQDHDGAFSFDGTVSGDNPPIFSLILGCYKSNTMDALRQRMSDLSGTVDEQERIRRTLICVAYIKKALPTTVQRYRLVDKAERFLQRFIKNRVQIRSLEHDIGRCWKTTLTEEERPKLFLANSTHSGPSDSGAAPSDTYFWRPAPGFYPVQDLDSNESSQLRLHDCIITDTVSGSRSERVSTCVTLKEHRISDVQYSIVERPPVVQYESVTVDESESVTSASATPTPQPTFSTQGTPLLRSLAQSTLSPTHATRGRGPVRAHEPKEPYTRAVYEQLPDFEADLVAYQDSRTHAARQHWGPTKPFDHLTEPSSEQPSRQTASSLPSYAGSAVHYTSTASAPYGSSHSAYAAAPASAAPRTQPADPYSAYQQPGGRDAYSQSSYSSYPAQAQSDPYGRSTASSTGPYATPSTTVAPGYYIASDGRQYPLSQQPQQPGQPEQPPDGSSGNDRGRGRRRY